MAPAALQRHACSHPVGRARSHGVAACLHAFHLARGPHVLTPADAGLAGLGLLALRRAHHISSACAPDRISDLVWSADGIVTAAFQSCGGSWGVGSPPRTLRHSQRRRDDVDVLAALIPVRVAQVAGVREQHCTLDGPCRPLSASRWGGSHMSTLQHASSSVCTAWRVRAFTCPLPRPATSVEGSSRLSTVCNACMCLVPGSHADRRSLGIVRSRLRDVRASAVGRVGMRMFFARLISLACCVFSASAL